MIDHIALVYAANDTLTSTEKHLLGAYCNHTDPHGYCWPGIERLCDETNLSRATIKRTNASLKKKGLIKSVRRVNPKTQEPITNLTRVNVALLRSLRRPEGTYNDNLMEAITFEEEPPETPPDLLMAQNEPYPGLRMSPTPAQNEPYPGLKMSPKTSLETSEEPSSPPSPPRADDAAHDPSGREDEISPENTARRGVSETPRAETGGTSSPPAPSADDETLSRAQALVDDAVRLWPRNHRAPGVRDRQRLAERVAAELGAGGDETVIVHELSRDLQDAGNAVRVILGSRTKTPGWGRIHDPRPDYSRYEVRSKTPWCGTCDERTRQVVVRGADGGEERMARCRRCHPEAEPAAVEEVVEEVVEEATVPLVEQLRAERERERVEAREQKASALAATRALLESIRAGADREETARLSRSRR